MSRPLVNRHMVRDSFGDYQPVSRRSVHRLLMAEVIEQEGVDGDEATNTVTYYFAPNREI